MNSVEFAHLNREHDRLKWNYRVAVDLLCNTGYLVSDAEYARLKRFVETARYDLEIIRAKIEQSGARPAVRQANAAAG
jgi:hypothetical protein